ncbi:uncharacterized protein LOC111337960 isoform X2 [Stylophora pistillata]|uniref:Uncharacterized protein n=1 Tax=Stylophora pistillata TaxID=50429 RepID=A0A2B4RPR4_STYPI|nr:uncharacterized protein LOC111337960 isoform X2 [Stylophora pistillata]PFX19601.1 hypothetical protein AWC38_SpisGene15979 [Stylophora pistillata]
MNKNRREADSSSSSRSMGNFVGRARSNNKVVIEDDDDDEIEEINTQEVAKTVRSDGSSRSRTRRQRPEAEVQPELSLRTGGSSEQNNDWDDDELQQVLIMSRIEAAEQEERRKMWKDVMNNIQGEIKPLKSDRQKTPVKESSKRTTGSEEDQRGRAESPDLFSTPPEGKENLDKIMVPKNADNDTDHPSSPPLPVTVRSNDTNPKDDSGKELSSHPAGSSSRQDKMDVRRKLKLRRTKRDESGLPNLTEKISDDDFTLKEVKGNDTESYRGKSKSEDGNNAGEKRKLELNDDDDDNTDDDEPILVLKKKDLPKRQKLISVVYDSDSDESQAVNKKGCKRSPDGIDDPSPKRMASSALTVRLSRQYKNVQYRPTTLKDAMKANLYFAPPGVNIPAYTRIIIRMFEKYRRQLHKAQSRVKTLIPWGSPVVAGSRQGDTLEPLSAKTTTSVGTRGSAFVRGSLRGETSPGIRNYSDSETSERRRTLRSSSTTVQQPTSFSTSSKSTSTATAPPFRIESDSDGDDGFRESYLDQLCTPNKNSSAKKTLKSSVRSGKISDFVETLKTREASLNGKSFLKKPTLSKGGVYCNASHSTDPKEESRKPADVEIRDSEMSIHLDSDELQSNAMGSSPQKGKKEKEILDNSTKPKGEADVESSASKTDILPDGGEVEGNVCLMETEQESQGDIIRPARQRALLRPFIEDDSTEDENDGSQPIFSVRFPGSETGVDCERPTTTEKEGTRTAATKISKQKGNVGDHLASQTLSLPSESQAMLSRSILEKMEKENDELMPSEALCDPEVTSSKLNREPEAVGEREDKEVSLTATSSLVKQTEESFVEEDHRLEVTENQRAKQKRSEAADRAAAAAENRLKTTKTRRGLLEACSSSSQDHFEVNQPDQITEEAVLESTVECPLCFEHFNTKEIEAHASDCQGSPSQAQFGSQTNRKESDSRSKPGPSFRSVPAGGVNTVYRTLSGERGELKDLRVVLQRSPLARQILQQKDTPTSDSGKRNLDFETRSAASGSPNQHSSSRSFDRGPRKPSRNTKGASRAESESNENGYGKNERDGSPSVHNWLETSSPEKEKPAWTFPGDYIPLNTTKEREKENESDRSKEQEHRQTSCRTEEVASDSDSSVSSDICDDSLMMQYGAQRSSARGKESGITRTEGNDENDIALAMLGGRRKKRPLSLSKSSKAKKSRQPRDSGSEEGDEFHVVCELCNKKIPKELYLQHVDEELEARKRTSIPQSKVEVVCVKDKIPTRSKDVGRRFGAKEHREIEKPSRTAATEDTDELEVDWDEVSDSPIKCFQFTENSNSVVDFENQFEHLKESKNNKRQTKYGQREPDYGRPSYRGGRKSSGNRGNYRRSSNRGYGRGKKNKKYRGSRGRK